MAFNLPDGKIDIFRYFLWGSVWKFREIEGNFRPFLFASFVAGPVFCGKVHRVSGVRDKSFYMLFSGLSIVFLLRLQFFHPDCGNFSP